MRNYLLCLLFGVLLGVAAMWKYGQHTGNEVISKQATNIVTDTTKLTRTDIITEKRTLPDGTKTQRTVTTIAKNEQEKQKVKEKTETKQPDNKVTTKWSLGVSLTPQFANDAKIEGKDVASITVGRRLGDTPLWGELGYDIKNKGLNLGIRVEF